MKKAQWSKIKQNAEYIIYKITFYIAWTIIIITIILSCKGDE